MPECTSKRSHNECKSQECKVQCIASLERHLKIYLKELNRVFCLKENIRRKDWWLSAFYSFCIQSIVRRGLIELIGYRESNSILESDPKGMAVKQYLLLPLRLFVAISGTYDPLNKHSSPNSPYESESHSDSDIKAAQHALKQDTWSSNGITSSIQYLQNIFEDSGAIVSAKATSQTSDVSDTSVDFGSVCEPSYSNPDQETPTEHSPVSSSSEDFESPKQDFLNKVFEENVKFTSCSPSTSADSHGGSNSSQPDTTLQSSLFSTTRGSQATGTSNKRKRRDRDDEEWDPGNKGNLVQATCMRKNISNVVNLHATSISLTIKNIARITGQVRRAENTKDVLVRGGQLCTI
jgi:hypothetical protein